MNLLLRKDNKQRANQLATKAIFKVAKRKSTCTYKAEQKYIGPMIQNTKISHKEWLVQYLFLK